MTRKIEYIIFNIYNWYYKMSLYRRQINPGSLTVHQFAVSAAMWVFLIYVLCDRLFIHHYLKKRIALPIIFMIWVLFYGLFSNALLDNFKYLDIYNKFKDYAANNAHAKRDMILSFLIVLLPFIIMIIYAFTGF
jgi:hypothetical protein